ncbi:MAG: hypothetical protein LKK03_00365 [Candidatus Methanomethylophilus sp.]|nr:hypothetical protein [Methanomethylophilus sp.]MCI2092325.1 hypothetical protein [Methanomethylophilus sp.]
MVPMPAWETMREQESNSSSISASGRYWKHLLCSPRNPVLPTCITTSSPRDGARRSISSNRGP